MTHSTGTPEHTGNEPEQTREMIFRQFQGKLGKSALQYLPAVVWPAIMGVAGVAIFTRVFATDQYGLYMLALTAVTIVVALLAGWLQQSVLRYQPRYSKEGRGVEFTAKLNTLLWVSALAFAALSAAIYALFSRSIPFEGDVYAAATGLIVVWMVFAIYNTLFQARLQSTRYARYQMAFATGRLVFSVALVFTVARDALCLIVGMGVAYAVLILPMMKDLGLLNIRAAWGRFDGEFTRRFASYGIPVVGWAIGNKLLELSDRFIIGMFRGTAEVGVYGANYNLVSMAMLFIAGPLLLASDPLVINAWEQGTRERIRDVISMFSRLFLLTAVPVATFLGVFAAATARIVFGEGFQEGYVIMPLVLAGLVFWNFALYGQKGLKLVEKTGLLFGMVLVSALINIGLNLILVPRYGYMGAAISTLVVYAFHPVMVYVVTRHHIPWSIPWRSVRNILLAASTGAAGCLVLERAISQHVPDWALLILGAVDYLLLYVIVLLMRGELTEYEIRFVSKKMRLGRGR
ncbi:MAG: polysaccharide biosynthesis C-terminal domain-containing protein [bacterium]|nr:polysaccharide biosynthesis C-terminal domain-containing protein [bacterium]